jgi:hypothetical protein
MTAMTPPAITGSCLCGAVAYGADGPFPVFQYCHCSRCRRFTGSAHGANIFCPPAQFAWTRGEDNVQRYALPEARYFATAFCKTCGSSLPWTNQAGTMVIIPAGSVEGEIPLKPQANIMWGSRASWYVPSSELETHDTTPPRRR